MDLPISGGHNEISEKRLNQMLGNAQLLHYSMHQMAEEMDLLLLFPKRNSLVYILQNFCSSLPVQLD